MGGRDSSFVHSSAHAVVDWIAGMGLETGGGDVEEVEGPIHPETLGGVGCTKWWRNDIPGGSDRVLRKASKWVY